MSQRKSRKNFYILSGVLVIFFLTLTLKFVIDSAKPYRGSLNNSQITTSKIEAKPKIFLSISKEQSATNSSNLIVKVSANSEKEILAIDIYLDYDQDTLSLVKVEPGNIFKDPLTFAKKNTPGKIFYALGSLTPSKLSGDLLKISFKIKDPKKLNISHLITINSSTLASVKGAIEAQINITE